MSDGLIEGGDELPSEGDGGSSAFRPSRRKVLAVAAWTVPVVIVGTAAPAFAASSAPVLVREWGGVCRTTNGSGKFRITTEWTNTYNFDITVKIIDLSVNGTSYKSNTLPVFRIPATSDRSQVIEVGPVPSPPPASVTVTITYEVSYSGSKTNYTTTSPTIPLTVCA